MGADVEGTVFAIVTCTMAPKAFGEGGSGATGDWDIKEVSGSRDDRMIVSKLHNERTIDGHSIFIEAIFRVYGSEGRGSVRWSWRR